MDVLKYPCVICGIREATTRDHVPPKTVFTKPLPTTLVTVPACALCNNGSADFDEKFRVYLGLVVGDKNANAKKLWKERSMATLRKNKKLAETISKGMHEVDVLNEYGVRVGKKIAFLWPVDVFECVVERIARGLYYHHFGEILGARVQCTVGFMYTLSDDIMESTKDLTQSHIGDGAFTYRYGRAAESPLHSVWVFEFYQGHWASVVTSPINASAVLA